VSGTLNVQALQASKLPSNSGTDKPYVVPYMRPQSEGLPPELGIDDQQAFEAGCEYSLD